MEKIILYPSSHVDDLSVSPSKVFDACGMCRIDARAQQHLQKMVARNVAMARASALQDSESRANN